MHIYASYEMAKFIPWPPDKRRASFFHIVNWFKNLLIRLFTVACKRIRDASRYTSKKISLKFLFLSDIFLFPFVRQQFSVLA